MAFSTTFTFTINAVAVVLNRINQDQYGSEWLYRTVTDEYRMKIRHSKETPKKGASALLRGVDRHNMELTHTIFATATVPEIVRQFYTVYRVSPGDDLTGITNDLTGFVVGLNGGTVKADMLAWLS